MPIITRKKQAYTIGRPLSQDTIAPLVNVEQLAASLNRHHHTTRFFACRTMGDLVWQSLEVMAMH